MNIDGNYSTSITFFEKITDISDKWDACTCKLMQVDADGLFQL